MAQMLAPYNNSMRLGQGFNSYTQQICLDQAVLADTAQNRARGVKKTITLSGPTSKPSDGEFADNQSTQDIESLDDSGNEGVEAPEEQDYEDSQRAALVNGSSNKSAKAIQVQPWVKPQIVTYSSRFVDKLSDVTDAMNISGSLSIKTATIGGKANGSYVDSDKFKSSDINFHLQVKVTNQILDAQNYTIFNKIDNVDASSFPEVYGDTFISGWEEGGELNAIISMKVHDKAKIFEIKVGLEAEMTTPTISGKVTGDYGSTKNQLSKETETTIAVNWSGGGSIKDPSEDWSIATLKKAAAAFPDLVAITPQRTYAILTKYTSLASFHQQNIKFSPLDYENAGIYTGALLDHYMDYKSLWKLISHATYELEGNRATIEMAQPTEDIYELAQVEALPIDQVDAKFKSITDGKPAIDNAPKQLTVSGNELQRLSGDSGSNMKKFTVFQPSFGGLIQARKVCRFEMAKIVNEVDLVAKNPKLSNDPQRDSYFLNPLLFKQLLPVVRSLSPENAVLGVKDPHAALILGYNQPQTEDQSHTLVYKLETDIKQHDLSLQTSIQRVSYKAHDYRMQGCAGVVSQVHSQAQIFNDLEKLDPTYRPSKISVWSAGNVVKGVEMYYANGEKKSHGLCEGPATHILSLNSNGSEVIVEVVVIETTDPSGVPIITSLSVATSACNVLDTAIDVAKEGTTTEGETTTAEQPKPTEAPKHIKSFTWSKPDESHWSLRGFFGFVHKGAISSLGIIWGKDNFVPVPSARISMPLCKNFLGLGPGLQGNIRSFKTLPRFSSFSEKFLMGNSITTNAKVGSSKYFNALDDIDVSWRMKTMAFASKERKLSGIKVIYHNGKELMHGAYSAQTEVWRCEVKSDLMIAKMIAGKVEENGPAYVDTLEFVRADQDGQLPAWPLDLSTLRYLGEGDIRVSEQISEVVESAPKMGNLKWSVRGFYGEHSEGLLTRLGVVWGRG